jgi:tetratricopeptide (TPR) repeat protein
MSTTGRRRVLLVGWDAADWKVIHPLMDAGKLPTVARLVDEGAMSNLATLHPVLSPMLWTSIATGKRPFKHGIHGFSEPTPDGTGIRPVTNLTRKTKAVWNILTQNGLVSNVVGWWPSHPAEPIRGVMVSNHFQRAAGPPEQPWPVPAGSVHPPRLAETLAALRLNPNELLAEHILPFVPLAAKIDQEQDRRLASCGRILAECTSVNAVATWLMRHEPWDFMAVYFDAIDHFGHGFMRYHPPRQEHVAERDFELYSGVIEAGYRYHDMMLNTLVQMAGPETTVILMSDHGFHPDHLRPRRIPAEPAGPAHEHRDFGIFVIHGPGIRRDTLLHGLGLLDITPTLLTLFGLPVGRDMDGRAVVEAFVEPPRIESVPSWDDVPGEAGLHPPDEQLDPLESLSAMRQLVELGYIEPPGPNLQRAIERTIRELRYNLARSYMDDGRHGSAAEILESLYDRWPNEHRFGVQLATCYQALERIADLRAVVEDLATRRKADADDARRELREFVRELRAKKADKETRRGGDKETRNDARLPVSPSPGLPVSPLSDDERRRFVELRGRARYNPQAVEYLWACVAMGEGDYERALAHLKRSEEFDGKRPGLHLAIGEACLRLRQADDAERSFVKAHSIDPDNPHVHLGLARVQLLRRDWPTAASAALRAIGLRHQLPMAHFSLGVALARMGRTLVAIDALETALAINPHFAEAHRLLAILHRRRLGDHQQAAEHRRLAREMRAARREALAAKRRYRAKGAGDWGLGTGEAELVPSPERPADSRQPTAPSPQPLAPSPLPITIVSGLPRSGTSMVMQMLAAGGMPVLVDDCRAADESNPRGYFEFERVKNLRADNSWLGEARGKAVKVIVQLLPALAMAHRYRIVYVERDIDEVLASQRRMLGTRDASFPRSAWERKSEAAPAATEATLSVTERRSHAECGNEDAPPRIADGQLRRTFTAQATRISAWLDRQPNVELVTVNHRQIIADPAAAATRIALFVGGGLDVAAMAAVVDPRLYRTRT